MYKMFAFYNHCKNIYGKDIVLSYRKILPNSDGCQFTLKNCQARKVHFALLIFTAICVCLSLPYILEKVDKVIYVVALLLLSAAAFLQSNIVNEENILVVPSVGLQYTTKYQYGRQSDLFIHWQDIKDIIINEVIHMHRIHYILTVIVNERRSGKSHLVPLFVNTKPRLKCLEEIYGEVQKVLTQ